MNTNATNRDLTTRQTNTDRQELKNRIFHLINNQEDRHLLNEILDAIDLLIYSKNRSSEELNFQEVRSNDNALAIEKREKWALEWLVG